MKKTIALFLVLVLTLGMMAGCSTTATQDKTPAPDSSADKVDTSSAQSEKNADPVSLTLVMYGDTTTRRESFFANDLHDRLVDELNIDLTVEFLPWSEMNGTTLTNRLASGESFAFENIISLNDYCSRGYLASVSVDDINSLMADYLDMRGENNGFDCSLYNGDVYCIPIGNKAYSGSYQSVVVRNDILNEVGWDYKDIATYDDLMAAIAAVKEAYPNIRVMDTVQGLRQALSEYLGDMTIGETTDVVYAFVDEAEDNDTVYSYLESDLFKNYCKTMEEWTALGYGNGDTLSNAGADRADWNAGNALLSYGTAGRLVEQDIRSTVPEADL